MALRSSLAIVFILAVVHVNPSGAFLSILEEIVTGIAEAVDEYFEDYDNGTESKDLDWLYELLAIDDCGSKPCENEGVCTAATGVHKCTCKEPYTGKNCEKVKTYCKKAKCKNGECVLTTSPPHYKCKCKHPFQGEHCNKHSSPCDPNPCQNGGSCAKGATRSRFTCICPASFNGRFCENGPNDCYSGTGDTYMGKASVTEDGEPCLYWNSYKVLQGEVNPFTDEAIEAGLGEHKYCRNPDSDVKPWCFILKKNKLTWNYCNISQCDAAPTQPTTPLVTPPAQTTPAASDEIAPSAIFDTCGKPDSSRVLPRIYWGRKALPGSHPWQVSLQLNEQVGVHEPGHQCGASLIKSCWALTAAHCIFANPSQYSLILGVENLSKPGPYEQVLEVEEIIVHENYTETNEALYNDVALLRLKPTNGHCANETEYVKTVCLPEERLADGTQCTISGWGATEKAYISNNLLDAKVLLISKERCTSSKSYGDRLDDSMFCAGNLKGGPDSCQGDSGGPLTCSQKGVHYLYGVVSWGDSCGVKNKPGIYADVLHFRDWITSKIN
ncbi:hyaluronan-binding protein 2 isoform X2 [Erpetoichthys calabaricus]|uniref:hyaluronan-binding protein 2 isoform X2 n=1 Tax=Erpetoichthys calabaricus TaxID=27687 RepID=UPI0022340665|nr:hyaluronan-binding protein 2 isoform X2 [Erpetoichthys calabaricus]